jgi:hypothetical protein
MLEYHGDDHAKGRSFHSRLQDVYCNISRQVAKVFADICPGCIMEQQRMAPLAGLCPIVTEGFGTFGQVDWINFQSMPDHGFNFLLNYIDHGIKALFCVPIVRKRASCVDTFSGIYEHRSADDPTIGNGRELMSAAMTAKQSHWQISLTPDFLDDVIAELKQLWPDCRMVCGSPRHSESNGGVERVNQTVQLKLAHWMRTHKSRRWTVGCKMVMWRYNTQKHRTIGDTPYRLLFGQNPRFGISSLPLTKELIDSLAT